MTLLTWRNAVKADKDSISRDPSFVGSDFSLAGQSECINRGKFNELLTEERYPLDFLATGAAERVRSLEIDIGVDEVDNPYLGKEFIRGDANESGIIDLGDASFITNYLFSGGEKPECLDAADADDNEVIEITDAIYISNFLFSASAGAQRWIPRPHPNCGVDPFGFDLFCSQNKPAPGCAP
jgi:hypothetical protein